jgi:NitT/TauT family transport system ATP-binding protein
VRQWSAARLRRASPVDGLAVVALAIVALVVFLDELTLVIVSMVATVFLLNRLRLPLDELHPLVQAARLLGWARVAHGDYDLTGEGRRVAAATVVERKTLFRGRVRDLPLIASILRALASGAPVPRETILQGLRAHVPPPEAERQVDTTVNWERWADLFDHDADDACFLRAAEAEW